MVGMMPSVPVVLVNMPWAMLRAPSIQLSTIKALLAKEDIASHVFNFNLEWMQHLVDAGFKVTDVFRLVDVGLGLGEWVFAIPPFLTTSDAEVESYRKLFSEENLEMFEKAREMRALVPSFISQCVDRIIAKAPKVAGFSTTFQQNVACLHLAQELKRRAPQITTVFGGANCDGPMGAALHRSFSFLDVVVRGEADGVVGPLFRDLLRGGPLANHPGVCSRNARELLQKPQTTDVPSMDDVPLPDHDDYFRDLETISFRGEIRPTWIPFESARGCWWGQKHHCTFCGLNGNGMKFRSKSPERTFEEISTFARKYKVSNFNATDNIIDMSYFETLLPELTKSGHDLRFFYETKANLKKSHLEAMAAAGILWIQPGIESLSTPILSLMRKGTTALQNIRLLKWAHEFHIEVGWNMIYGFPGEDPAEYAKMEALIPSLLHLEAPNVGRLEVHRFSPYHKNTKDYPLRLTGPGPFYKYVYPLDEETLWDIAYVFDYAYTTPQDPAAYAKPWCAALEHWRKVWRTAKLEYRRGPGFIEIFDRRGDAELYHELGEVEAQIYLMLDASATPKSVHEQLVKSGTTVVGVTEITAFLDRLVELRLAYEEDGRYLSLAVPARPPR